MTYYEEQVYAQLDALVRKVEAYRERCMPVCGQPPNFEFVSKAEEEAKRKLEGLIAFVTGTKAGPAIVGFALGVVYLTLVQL
jgi:hypothetical protein